MIKKLSHIKNKLTRRIFLCTKKAYWLQPKLNHYKQERIFIAGMQRSGTNMLMDILEKSWETDVYHERDARAFDNYQMRDRHTIQKLINQSRAPKFIIKALCELQDLKDLMEYFKPAKVIWIVRSYDDVVASMLKSFPNMEKQVIRIVYKGSKEWLGRGMTDETRNKLKDLIHEGMGDSSASALQWYFRNILFFDQKFDKDQRVLLISYED
ncbi:MAG: sulfotransferase domain-containing protein, partial [Methylomicrobium sp.]|nr:sulfotransferase domain-containing protein [Methylomicrobium sp.]